MSRRYKLSRRASRSSFKRGVNRVHKVNVSTRFVARGGIRL